MKKLTHALLLILSIQLQAMEEGIVDVDTERKEIASILVNLNRVQDTANIQDKIQELFDYAKECQENGIKVKLARLINTLLKSSDLTDAQIEKINIRNQTLIDALQSLKGTTGYRVKGKKIVSVHSQYYKSKNQSLEKYLNDLLSGNLKSQKPSSTILPLIKNKNISLQELSTMKLKSKDNKTIDFLEALSLIHAKTCLGLFKKNENGELIYNEKKSNARKKLLEYKRTSYRERKIS